MAVCNNHLPFQGFSLDDKANSVGQGIDIPLRSIVVNLRIKSRIDCLVVLFRCISVSISREGVFGEWLILLEGSGVGLFPLGKC